MPNYKMNELCHLPRVSICQKIIKDDEIELHGEQSRIYCTVSTNCNLYIPQDDFVHSVSINGGPWLTNEVTFRYPPPDDTDAIAPGKTFSFGRWPAALLILILDQDLRWRKKYFKPQDAWSYADKGWRTTLPPGKFPPRDAKNVLLLPNGWDHEHCTLCFARISPHEFPFGYVKKKESTEYETWVCPSCYERRIVPHTLVDSPN